MPKGGAALCRDSGFQERSSLQRNAKNPVKPAFLRMPQFRRWWQEEGSGVHFLSMPVKYLADLRSRVNSQQYSSIYEDRRPKIEDIERSDSETRKPGVLKR